MPPDLVEIARCRRLGDAEERGLVVAAMDRPHWILRSGLGWALCVEAHDAATVTAELARYEHERTTAPVPLELPTGKPSTLQLWLFAWTLLACFIAQQFAVEALWERGVADSTAMLRGEWWRAVTALTLHADVEHFAANLAAGLLFSAFLLPMLGHGWTWLAILASGTLGNALNAWIHRDQGHLSLGASTAVFGALGLLVGAQIIFRLARSRTARWWELILPIGAGLALLGFLGTGGGDGVSAGQTDILAHLWGFLFGLLLGLTLALCRVKKRTSAAIQHALAAAAFTALIIAWSCVVFSTSVRI